jgi:hypothetical protein
MWIGYEGFETSGYDQPSAITFINIMIEADIGAGTGNALIKMDGGGVRFINANFVNGLQAPMFNLTKVAPAYATHIVFDSCSFQGSPAVSKGITLNGWSTTAEFIGPNGFTGMLTGITLVGGGLIRGTMPLFNNVGTPWNYLSGSTWYGSIEHPVQKGIFQIINDDGYIPSMRIGQASDGGMYRTFLLGDGRVGFSKTAGLQPSVTLGDGTTDNDMRISDGGVFRVGAHSALPSPTWQLRGGIAYVQAGAGVADTVYMCIKNAADGYDWKQITFV